VLIHPSPNGPHQRHREGGTDKARIVDHAELANPPVAAIEQAIAFVHRHMQRSADIGTVRRKIGLSR
jgi:predicted HTH transcriptional regulator